MDKFKIVKDVPYLECIVGPMFSGKSQELNRRLTNIDYYNRHRAQDFNGEHMVSYIILRPDTDTRADNVRVLPYADKKWVMVPKDDICHTTDGKFINLFEDYDYVILDEAQFFDKQVIEQVRILLEDNKYVIVAGLDKDYRGEPFSDFMKWVLSVSDETTKLTAICANCGAPSTMAKLIVTNPEEDLQDNIIIEDENHRYVPVCRKCMYKDNLFLKGATQ